MVSKHGVVSPLSRTDEKRLDNLYQHLQKGYKSFVGYPCNGLFDYSSLYRFLQFPINNVGDPHLPSNYQLNTHSFEHEVLEVFCHLTGAPKDSTWGYVTNGGTEGNHYGLFLGRETIPDGILYFSQDAHYSIEKISRFLSLRTIRIHCHPDGRMDLKDLRETLSIHRDSPPIVCVTVGTTMKGAVDDIKGIQQIFRDLALRRHYIHVDAALGGMILPFIDNPPPWNFQTGIDSIAISGHKMVGSPIPCGVVLAKKAIVERIGMNVEYIGTVDTTLSSSRSGLAPLFLWYAFRTVGFEGYREMIRSCLRVADYAITQLNKINRKAWRHPFSNTVVFNRPPDIVARRWQLACEEGISHLITMPHVTRAHIDRVVADIQEFEKPHLQNVIAAPAPPVVMPSEQEVS